MYSLKLCIFDFSRYSSLLSDCQHCYLSQRSQLLMPCVSDAIDKLAKQYERNPCSLVSFLNPFPNVAGLAQLLEYLTAEQKVAGNEGTTFTLQMARPSRGSDDHLKWWCCLR